MPRVVSCGHTGPRALCGWPWPCGPLGLWTCATAAPAVLSTLSHRKHARPFPGLIPGSPPRQEMTASGVKNLFDLANNSLTGGWRGLRCCGRCASLQHQDASLLHMLSVAKFMEVHSD